MGKPEEPGPAKLFMSLIALEDDIFHRGMEQLRLNFGEMDFISERFPFNFTDYYAREMGEPLFRHFVTFKSLISMAVLPDIKGWTNGLEEGHVRPDGNRRINIDPGYLCLAHIVLATTKGYSHRPYLREGIYADLTLIYRDRSFQPLEWTYPDYRQKEVIGFFNQIRKRFLEDQRRKEIRPC